MKKVFIPIVVVVALVACAKTKDATAKPTVVSGSLTDVNKYKLIAAFLKSQQEMSTVQTKAMDLCRADQGCSTELAKYNQAVAQTNQVADEVRKNQNWPPATSFNINTDTNDVQVSIPQGAK